MVTNQKDINHILQKAKNIFYKDIQNNKVMLVYYNNFLVASHPPAKRPISNVAKIIFDYNLSAWQVIWLPNEQY